MDLGGRPHSPRCQSEVDLGRTVNLPEAFTMADDRESEGESSTAPLEKRVVLFCKTGAGKSTMANALVTGSTESPGLFKSSGGALGCTREFQRESGRGWTVLDPIGLGGSEPIASANTGCTDQMTPMEKLEAAKEKLKTYLKDVSGKYSHIIYVMKADRMSTIDEVIWTLFEEIFKGGEDAFVIAFTGKSEEWLEKQRDQLPVAMKKVQNICVVDIPPKHSNRVIEAGECEHQARTNKEIRKRAGGFFEKRNSEYAVPLISQGTDDDIDKIADTILKKVVEKLKSLFKKENWINIAKLLVAVIEITGFVLAMS